MAFNFTEYKQRLEKAIDHVSDELNKLRTGRASMQMLDGVKVEAYGTFMSIAEVASVTVPDPNQIIISPWDKSLLGAIERGITIANLGVNPTVDGHIIRMIVPSLTQERREEMVKLLHQKVEQGKVMFRTVRTETKKQVDDQKGEDGISEDDISADLKNLDDILRTFEERLTVLCKDKERDLMTV